MADSSNVNGHLATDSSTRSHASVDTIVLNVLSPSPEIPNGRISFPSMPLDTTIGHLKSRISHSIVPSLDPARQRLIYRGRAMLDTNTTLRQVFLSELTSTPSQQPTCAMHLVVSSRANMPSTTSSIPTPTSQGPSHSPQPAFRQQPAPNNVGLPDHRDSPSVQPADMVNDFSNQLDWARQQHEAILASLRPLGLDGNQNPLPEQRPARSQATEAEEIFRRHYQNHMSAIGLGTVANPIMNGQPPGPPSDPANQGFGPMRTSIHETVGADGMRTRVVVNEGTFELSRQPTPDPRASQADRPAATLVQNPSSSEIPNLNVGIDQRNETSGVIPPTHPQGPAQQPVTTASPFIPPLFLSPHQAAAAQLRMLQDPRHNQNPWAATTTAFLLSGPEGPHALVFSPGQGVLSTAPPRNSSTTGLRSRAGYRSPNFTNTRNRHHAADISRAAAPGQAPSPVPAPPQAPARPRIRVARQAQVHPVLRIHFHRNILQPTWTFIKLCVAIIMFTEPGTWLRKCLFFAAFVVSVMPTSNVIQNTLRWLQVQVDGILGPPPAPSRNAAAPQAPGSDRRPTNGNNNTVPQGQAATVTTGTAPDHGSIARPALPAAHEQNIFERAEQALGLFMASLVPGVGERHVRAREEARQEEARREEARQEEARQEEIRQEEARTEKSRAEQARTEAASKDSQTLGQKLENDTRNQGESASNPTLDPQPDRSAHEQRAGQSSD